ncbi:pyridoxal phosphate-dependent decarboxylase family protein [Proteus mirabilis]|uniref:pyridoxal phosphate-dependent decarboxylase family protein n=1 Tax=Proteus mirabilis TaxID=584 RepID=UPI0023606604|nr:pyridoxal-dependent decarboxylase [Proteus mirabilis]
MKSQDLLGLSSANILNAEFEKKYRDVITHFFSRDPQYWPIFQDKTIQSITQFRKTMTNDKEQLQRYENGQALFDRLMADGQIQQHINYPENDPNELLMLVSTLCKNWENPLAVENVIAMPSDPGVYGSILGLMGNPNMVYCEYSGVADVLEKVTIKKVAKLVGYDPEVASGVFTQGGTMCNLYGYLFGLRKSMPNSKHLGMAADQDYRIINSQGGHYSNMTNLALLGVDVNNKTIRIKVSEDNTINLEHLERELRACFTVKCKVPTIMLTTGTTDTFGVDDVKGVCELRDRLCEEFEIAVKPHIHVDAAVGWPIIFFLDYDFNSNPLAINDITLEGLRQNVAKFKHLKYADSITIDFHKWGYVPYTSSLVLVKNGNDFVALENDPENFTYFEHELEGQTHLQSTIECTRSGVGIFGAYSAMHYMGIEGYQTIIAHCLQNANYMRHQLLAMGNAKVIVPQNQGPSVGFKLYDPNLVSDPNVAFDLESTCATDKEAYDFMVHNAQWHRKLFLQRGKKGLFTNWVDSIACSKYAKNNRYVYIPGEKAVFMNPNTERSHIDNFLKIITEMSHSLSAKKVSKI